MLTCPSKIPQYTNSSCTVEIKSDFYSNFTLNISFGDRFNFIQVNSLNSSFKLFNLFDRVGYFKVKAILIETPLYVETSVEGTTKNLKLRYN